MSLNFNNMNLCFKGTDKIYDNIIFYSKERYHSQLSIVKTGKKKSEDSKDNSFENDLNKEIKNEFVYNYDGYIWKNSFFKNQEHLENYLVISKKMIPDYNFITPYEYLISDNYVLEKMDDLGCDLFDYIENNILSEKEMYNLIYTLIFKLYTLHQMNIAHRDIKPENIIYNGNADSVYYIDFNMSTLCDDKEIFNGGTANYACPEIIYNKFLILDDWRKADMWSLGITIYIILFKQYPWNNLLTCKFFKKYKNSQNKYDYWFEKTNDVFYSHILTKCLDLDENKRTSSKLLYNYIQNFKLKDLS